ncbi:chloroplastic import inner membrane translocase subunit HP30-2 [Andrographis paniculata]|uniref:chloroplastic import inner membrane translocase subunit HP30-2 n=1 Tax=Andrographis paniculata TaxID=175694 RepID=UPI0021E753E6|nr:chloroplastic import inner membrane translocase subunit HP30-2 [Andrographis paniculata]
MRVLHHCRPIVAGHSGGISSLLSMGEGKQGVMAVAIGNKAGGGGGLVGLPNQNPIVLIQAKLKEVEVKFKEWLAKQSLPVEAAVVTATSAGQGAAIGAFMGTLTGDASSLISPPPNAPGLNPEAMASLKQAQALSGGPLVQARNFAVMTGVNAGISCVMKRLRGKEDVQSSMVAAFGSGAMFSLVSGMGGPNQAMNAVTSGLFFALVQGGLFQLGQKFSQPPVEDVFYVKTRSMLSNLGLQNYEKNFKRGLLTDTTLPLLTDSALRDVKIPPGPRLLILDHIDRDPELKGRRRGGH